MVATGPEAVAVGDFNGDGVLDIATANVTNNNVTVLLGFVVGHTAQTIAFGALGNVANGVSPFMIGATASSGLAVGFASNANVCTVTGTTVTIVNGGLCSIVAVQAGNATYAPAAAVTQSFTVNPGPQTIAFGPLAAASLGVSPFDVSATASSGFTVSFASITSSVCTVSGTTVTLLATGTCSITASQAGNANYTAAATVTQSFTVVASATTYLLTTVVSPADSGSLAVTPALPLEIHYAVSGTTVCLTASPAAGQIFAGWTGTALNAAGCLTMTASCFSHGEFYEANPVSATSALRFVPATPCRLVDTRNSGWSSGWTVNRRGGSARSFTIPGTCGNIPSTALAYSLNLTVVPQGPLGYVTMWPTGQTQPLVSTLNSPDGRIKSNAAIVPAGTSGASR